MASLEEQRLGEAFPCSHQSSLPHHTPSPLLLLPVDLTEDEFSPQPLPALSDFRHTGSAGGTGNKSQDPPVAEPAAPRAVLQAQPPLCSLCSQILQAKCFSSSPCLQNYLIRLWGFFVFLLVVILFFTAIDWLCGRKSFTSIPILKFLGSYIFSFNDSTAIKESIRDANLLNIQHILSTKSQSAGLKASVW